MSSLFVVLLFSFFPKYQNNCSIDGVPVQQALEMAALCNTFSLSRHFPNTNALIPLGYRKIAQTEETPLLNVVQIYKKKSTLILVFRGTIDETNSWLENAHFMQIPATNKLEIDGNIYNYNYSNKPESAVHSGYVLATAFLWGQLKNHLDSKALQDVNQIALTGHSQGGALAQMFLAQMNLMSEFSGIELINFSFGSPRIGNQAFTDDFNQRFTVKNLSFRFVNPSDIVCDLPILNKSFDIDIKGVKTNIDLETIKELALIGMEFLPSKYKRNLDLSMEATKYIADEIIKHKVGNVDFPAFSSTIFYGETGKLITLESMSYPDYLDKKLDKDNNSWLHKINLIQSIIQRELTFFQHSNFTYYNAIHEYYKPKRFRRLFLKTLPEKFQ